MYCPNCTFLIIWQHTPLSGYSIENNFVSINNINYDNDNDKNDKIGVKFITF